MSADRTFVFPKVESLYPGVVKLRLGTPEAETPVGLRSIPPKEEKLAAMPCALPCPLPTGAIRGRAARRGFLLELPLDESEQLYGLGLQMHSLNQRKKKKMLRVNSDPVADTGDSHAPVPFYVSTAGYGVLVDTARYAVFYGGSAVEAGEAARDLIARTMPAADASRSAEELYASRPGDGGPKVVFEIPVAQGVDVYVFWGDDLQEAVCRYNLFSGGGVRPPHWGLGAWYRVRSDFAQEEVQEFASSLRASRIPCDVLGLEPGWQSHAYPCSFEWSQKFPDPAKLIASLAEQNYHVNLWTHAFVHPASPVYGALEERSGDYAAFSGRVPDLADPDARAIISRQHEAAHVALGISGYKLDECDNSDFTKRNWSFPEISQFPSGLDGEQMHSLYGLLYQEAINAIFRRRNLRTYSSVRSSHALAAPHPFVLYSDLYDHRVFIRAIATSGFSGLLWSPEVRDASGPEDLVRRIQSVVFSAQALINAWYIKHPPWKQWVMDQNNADQLADGWEDLEAICRTWLEWRMRLIPYLYAAFARYEQDGTPPFRALVMDWPHDPAMHAIDDQYMMGESLLVAPVFAGQSERNVYLPAGPWHDFWTGERLEGGREIVVATPLDHFPVFVKGHALIPLAEPSLSTSDSEARTIVVRVYGDGTASAILVEDDGSSRDYLTGAEVVLHLHWNAEAQTGDVRRDRDDGAFPRYEVIRWERIGV